ncbi:hypothetical protein C7E25_23640, partial [Stenotrophomonas maltophilia]
GAFERMQAQQAIATLDKAKRRDQELATYLAERRVEIAETAVRTALAAREVGAPSSACRPSRPSPPWTRPSAATRSWPPTWPSA